MFSVWSATEEKAQAMGSTSSRKRLKRSEVVASEVYSLLQLVPFEYCGLGKRVTDVNYQIHFSGAKLLIELEFAKPNVF